MSALAGRRKLRKETWQYQTYKLPTGKTAYENGLAVYDQSAGKCIPAEIQTDLFVLGFFFETVANASGSDKDVTVRLKREVHVTWMKNDGTNPVTANDIGKAVYAIDDQTVSVSSDSAARSAVGTAWAIDATRGVAVEIT